MQSHMVVMGLMGNLLFFCLSLLFSCPTFVWAARPASSCSLDGNNPQAIVSGTNVNTRLPIASVSKLITTYWALSTMRPLDKFETRIYITPEFNEPKVGKVVDIHISGSRDPYFGKESIHYLISELNKLKIFRIRNLTFDEDFKFFWNVSGGKMLSSPNLTVETGYYGPDSPTAKEVNLELKAYRRNYTVGYNTTRSYLKKFKIDLVPNPKMYVANVYFVRARDFQPVDGSLVRVISSSPLITLLKEMNRNSNNHAANQIFEKLGGAEIFNKFMKQEGYSESEILFVNGHGNRKDVSKTESVYNEATCATVVKIISSLRNNLLKLGKDLDDVLPVPGVDTNSTLGAYHNKSYEDAIAAKTGTIGPAVTLAGMLQTRKGPVFFMYNMSTRGTVEDWQRARSIIARQLIGVTKINNGGLPFETQLVKFVAFDPELFFQEEDWKQGEHESPVPTATQLPAATVPRT